MNNYNDLIESRENHVLEMLNKDIKEKNTLLTEEISDNDNLSQIKKEVSSIFKFFGIIRQKGNHTAYQIKTPSDDNITENSASAMCSTSLNPSFCMSCNRFELF